VSRHAPLRRAVILVAGLNLAYFGVEFAVARLIGSVVKSIATRHGGHVDIESEVGRGTEVKVVLPV
jgi:hypothetical protein